MSWSRTATAGRSSLVAYARVRRAGHGLHDDRVPGEQGLLDSRVASDPHHASWHEWTVHALRSRSAHLPPGDYLLAAVTDLERNEEYDPAFLASLVTAAVPVTLLPGQRKVQDLVVK